MSSNQENNSFENMGNPAVLNIFEANIPLKDQSDDALIMLVQKGDPNAFRVLVERYQERVRNLIYSIFSDPSIVEDLSQDIFIKVYEALPNFRFQSSFYTWLYRITVNKSRDEMRRRKVRKILSFGFPQEEYLGSHSDSIADHQEQNETKELLEKGLQSIPEKYRLPIILKDIDGMSYEEIASILQCEVGTVKSRLSRGRNSLKKILEPYFAY